MGRVFSVKESIGKLRQIETILNSTEAEEGFVSINKFVAIYRNINILPNYGTLAINELTIYQDGKVAPIEIKGFTFDPCIGYKEHYTRSSNSTNENFTIIGRSRTGEIFELSFSENGSDILSYVIYAMVFIAFNGIEDAQRYWSYLTGSVHFRQNLNLDEQINCLKKLSLTAKECIKEYPFMEYFYQNGLKTMKTDVIESFNAWDILK